MDRDMGGGMTYLAAKVRCPAHQVLDIRESLAISDVSPPALAYVLVSIIFFCGHSELVG